MSPHCVHLTDLPGYPRLKGTQATWTSRFCSAWWPERHVRVVCLSLFLLPSKFTNSVWGCRCPWASGRHTLSRTSRGLQCLNSKARFPPASSPLGEKAGEGHLGRPARCPQVASRTPGPGGGLVFITALLLCFSRSPQATRDCCPRHSFQGHGRDTAPAMKTCE